MKKRILYIEDNLNNRLVVKRILEAEGYELIEAVDGESAWGIIERESPDLILIDLFLPGMDGLEFTKLIKSDPRFRDIPLVALTAYGDTPIEKAMRRAGCDDFLHKPANVQQIRAVTHRFLGPA